MSQRLRFWGDARMTGVRSSVADGSFDASCFVGTCFIGWSHWAARTVGP